MRSFRSIGIVSAILISLAVLFALGCKSGVERRRLNTLERLNWSGGTVENRRVRDALSNAVASATARSLATPQLVDALVWIGSLEKTNGLLSVNWISDACCANGVKVLFSDSTSVNVLFDHSGLDEIEKESKGTVLHGCAISRRDAPEIWAKLAPTQRVRVVLTMNGSPVSNELDLRFFSQ
jgi:hypothetical protein